MMKPSRVSVGTSDGRGSRFRQCQNKPVVIDADALNLLCQQSTAYTLSDSILTPHAGEAARLLGVSIDTPSGMLISTG